MSEVAIALLLIIGLFVAFLLLKKFVERWAKYCTICLAVSGSWIILLFSNKTNLIDNQIIIGILMGQSSLGVYYLIEKRVNKNLLIFRLPMLLTLIFSVYTIITGELKLDGLLLNLAIWVVGIFLYVYRSHPSFKSRIKALVDCCGNW